MPKRKPRYRARPRRTRRGPIPVYKQAVGATARFGHEVRKNIGSAIAAAFAFIIALVWRDIIQETVNGIIADLGLAADGMSIRFIAALITTAIAVTGIWYFSRWSEKEDERK